MPSPSTYDFIALLVSSSRQWRSHLRHLAVAGKPGIILLALAWLIGSPSAVAQTVKYSAKKVPIENVFKSVEEQTGYMFFYNQLVLQQSREVTIHAEQVPLLSFLALLFKDQPLKYSIENKAIIVSRKSIVSYASGPVEVVHQQPAFIPVKGQVYGDDGTPLAGASIMIKGKPGAVVSDESGSFTIEAERGEVLVLSYVGYDTKEVKIERAGALTVNLVQNASAINNVVVVGYGTQSKRAVTGAVTSIGFDKFKDRSFSNVTQSLAGQVAGVNISQAQGAPGVSPIIRIRGVNSITAGSNPLFVIDGVPLENFNLNMINPQDIESVEVLKDASSAAIYGSRGSSGVIIVTTKLGKPGKVNINASFEYGIQEVTRKMEMMDAQQWIQYYITAKNNSWVDLGGGRKATDPNSLRAGASTDYVIPEEFLNNPGQFGKGTDWQDVMYRVAPLKNAQLSVSGGTNNTQYLFSAGYLDQEAILDANYYKRLSLRSNIKQSISPKFTIGLNLALTGIYDRTDGTQGKSDVIGLALQSSPIFSIYNENGNIGMMDPNSSWNRYLQFNPISLWHPYSTTRYTDKQNKALNALGTAFAEYKLFNDLKFRTSINANAFNNRNSFYLYKNQGYGFNQSLRAATGTATSGYMLNWLWENTLNYQKQFKEHSFNLLAGYTAQKQRDEFQSATASNYPNDLVQTLSAGTVTSGTSTLTSWSMISHLARLSYDFKNRYFLTSTIRRDGSSRFGSNNQWGYFPSVSAGWIASDEAFMSGITGKNLLKFRASYGVAGNNQIPNYGPVSLLGAGNYASGNTLANGLSILSIPNPDLKWEKTTQLNLGVDIGLMKNRINISAEYYNSITKDMLLNVPVPDISGFATQLTNIGAMRNRGVEFTIASKNLIRQLSWTTDLNFSLNRNKILKLGPGDAPIYYNDNETTVKMEVGQPISNFYGYIFDGIYNNQSQIDKSPHEASTKPGDPIIRDVNGDNKITTDDRTIIGNYQPDFAAGIVNTFSYKGIELSVLVQGSFGGEIVNQNYRFLGYNNRLRNLFAKVNNYWKSESDPGDGINPRPTMVRKPFQTAFSNLWVEDASFVRIKNVRVSYALPAGLLKKTPFRNLRIYVNADNVKLFSNYTGYDPENTTYSATSYAPSGTEANTGTASSSRPSGVMVGFDYGSYPIPRVITFGIKSDF